ncbi:hypothetical protein Aduo_019152 [Ancylostoma duodenale]
MAEKPTVAKDELDEKLERRLLDLESAVNQKIDKAVEVLTELLKTPKRTEPKDVVQALDGLMLLEDDPEVAQKVSVPLVEDTVPEQVPEPYTAPKEDTVPEQAPETSTAPRGDARRSRSVERHGKKKNHWHSRYHRH